MIQRLIRNIKLAHDMIVSLLRARQDGEDTERQMQEEWESMLRDLKRLENVLTESEDKHYRAKMAQATAALGSTRESENTSSLIPNEESVIEAER